MRCIAVAMVFLTIGLAPARGVVLHPELEPPDVWNRPADGVVGQWMSNGSCVAIGRAGWTHTQYVTTTRHQNWNVGNSVWFGLDDDRTQYRIAQIWEAPKTGGANTDLRIARLTELDGTRAYLSDFAQWYTGGDEVGKQVVIGGYGKGRGTDHGTYYEWEGSANDTLRWGTNRIDSSASYGVIVDMYYKSYVMVSDFDDHGTPGATDYEAAAAQWDSGGGVFIQDDGDWYVAGLMAYASHGGRSYYNPPDQNRAIRLSRYESFMDDTLAEEYGPVPGDANLDDIVTGADYTIWADHYDPNGPGDARWEDGDFNGDGYVTGADYTIWADHYGTTAVTIPDEPNLGTVPEPTTMALLSVGGLGLLRRRRR